MNKPDANLDNPMTNALYSFESIIWPANYVHKAYQRSTQFPDGQEDLKALYQSVFEPFGVLGKCAPFTLPFSKDIDLNEYRAFLSGHTPQLPLSIVTITRNDNHVERMQERTQAFIDCIYWLSERHETKVELIIVEWNPPGDRPPVKEAFNFVEQHPFVSVIIVRVPPEIHAHYTLSENLPLYQMIGKNAGIRRARGNYILSTNIDVLLSDELFQFITSDQMQPGKLYRSNRWDIDRKVLDLESPEEMLGKARDLCFQINYSDGVRAISEPEPDTDASDDSLCDTSLAITHLHTWACGDFQLLHRDDWARVSGYSELDVFSFHLDSLFSITCHYASLDEVSLSNEYPHYHIDHTLGTPVKSNTYVINENKALYHIPYMTLFLFDFQMKENGDHFVFNDSGWGLAGFDLPFTQVTRAHWERVPPDYKKPGFAASKPSSILSTQQLEKLEKDDQDRIYRHYLRAHQQTANYLRSRHSDKKCYIWGAGERGKIHCTHLINHGVAIAGFIHGTDSTCPDYLLDLPVYKRDRVFPEDNCFYLVASIYAEEIRVILEKQGKAEGTDYMVLF
ncbi:MAG: hypothetical protein CSB48_10320 [Proteobacteria bacterium]|nr:MAG: hypothetical protein CSB48_10320 [Pseudomonadota bacterium]